MQGTLYVAMLSVRSSYIREIEEPLDGVGQIPDTVQWWISDSGVWRIKTYALDHDIHTFSIGRSDLDFAKENTRKHFGDVIDREYEIRLTDPSNDVAIKSAFRAVGLEPQYEIATDRFVFWKPDDAKYHTQSAPK